MPNTFDNWIGRSESHGDILRPEPARFMQATLGQEPGLGIGDPLPPLWHWLYFLDAKPLDQLGRDGHPKKGGFLPPVALPRRMWAGGRFTFHTPLPLGARIKKRSTIKAITEKSGRSGELCFVTVVHEVLAEDGTLALTEEHDIVYREDPKPNASKPAQPIAPADAEVSEMVTPSEVMLFRYSALTFNGHRIHYDVDYARTVEGYSGLVFHGPLTATLLADLASRSVNKPLKTFAFKGLSPITGMAPFQLQSRASEDGLDLWARRQDGVNAMQACATF